MQSAIQESTAQGSDGAVRQRIDPRSGKVTFIHPESFWREHERRRLASGLTIDRYCESNELANSTYRRWCAKLAGKYTRSGAKSDHDRAARAAGFVPIQALTKPSQREARAGAAALTPGPSEAPEVQIEWSTGVTVRLRGAGAARALDAVIARLPGAL